MQVHKVEMIPLNELGSSKKNARRTAAGETKHKELMASIKAHDVLSSLVVRKLDRPKADGIRFAVIAGERRLRALQGLAAEGEVAKTRPVPCHVRRGKAAEDFEVSLAENTVRAEMNAVDKYEGYRELAEGGKSPAEIAKAFGTSPRAVEQFLRLADIHEEILEAARQDKIKPASLMAFAASGDKSRQLQVWKQATEHYGEPNAAWIRSEMLREHLAASHGKVRFIGVEAYEQAGGRIERDLFAEDDDDVFLTDVKLVDELAKKRLDAVKAQLEVDWAWASATFDVRHDELGQYGRIEGVAGALTAEETARIEEIGVEITRIETLLDRESEGAENDEEADALEEELRTTELDGNLHSQLQKLRSERRRIQEQRGQRATFDPAQMRHAGVIVTIDEHGGLYKYSGLVREADAPKMPAAGQAAPTPEAAEPAAETPQTPRLADRQPPATAVGPALDVETPRQRRALADAVIGGIDVQDLRRVEETRGHPDFTQAGRAVAGTPSGVDEGVGRMEEQLRRNRLRRGGDEVADDGERDDVAEGDHAPGPIGRQVDADETRRLNGRCRRRRRQRRGVRVAGGEQGAGGGDGEQDSQEGSPVARQRRAVRDRRGGQA